MAGNEIFENDEWVVTDVGLYHKQRSYMIERAMLDRRRDDGLWDWPLVLATEPWCKPGPMVEAFTVALAHFGIAPDPKLGLTLYETGRIAVRHRVFEHVARELGYTSDQPIAPGDRDLIAAEMSRRAGI